MLNIITKKKKEIRTYFPCSYLSLNFQTMLINELIEKAFCEGYEYGQKEFG